MNHGKQNLAPALLCAALLAVLPGAAPHADPLGDAVRAGDDVAVVRIARQLAEADDAAGQYQLGIAYRDAIGVGRDYGEAVKWLRRAADQGLASAENALGGLYVRGSGVPQDLAQALTWFRKAAEQGDASAQNRLGLAYANGQGERMGARRRA